MRFHHVHLRQFLFSDQHRRLDLFLVVLSDYHFLLWQLYELSLWIWGMNNWVGHHGWQNISKILMRGNVLSWHKYLWLYLRHFALYLHFVLWVNYNILLTITIFQAIRVPIRHRNMRNLRNLLDLYCWWFINFLFLLLYFIPTVCVEIKYLNLLLINICSSIWAIGLKN